MDKRGKNKKGLLMLETIIKLLIAVIAIGLIIYAGVVLVQTYFGKPGEMQAKGTLNAIIQTIDKANESGITEKLLVYNPTGWYLVSFDSNHNENNDFKKPSALFNKNCICICEKGAIYKTCKVEICREIKMPLKQAGEQAFIKIEIKDLYFTNMKDYWNISEKPIAITKLTDDEKQEYKISKIRIKQDYEDVVAKISEQYYSEIPKYFNNAADFGNFLFAVISVESNGKVDFKSKCGNVGLMQLMPDTAKNLGMDIPDYTEICDKSKNNICAGAYSICYNAFECNSIEPEKCDKEKDERFDPEKNIEAGAKYLALLIKQFDDKQLALAAYDTYPGDVQKNCGDLLNIYSCPPYFAGRKYSEKVMAKYLA